MTWTRRTLAGCLGLVIVAHAAQADELLFSDADFAVAPSFNSAQTFDFRIDLDEPLTAGTAYNNPALSSVEYRVLGNLTLPTPSGFPSFDLVRTITGADFYAQGSSLQFEIAGGANLSDGLQVSELVGATPVFVFNGREVDTGRYHPPLLQLNSDGTGSIRNSNNMGGINPGSDEVVDVEIGDEYITELMFDPAQTTIGVPEPSSLLLAALCLAFLLLRKAWKSMLRVAD